MRTLLFSNPWLENRFRCVVQEEEGELGGYLLLAGEPRTWPGRFSLRALKALSPAVHLHGAEFIEGIIVIPNAASRPKVSWSALAFDELRETAEATGAMLRATAVHFHTHTNRALWPSDGDRVFAARNCEVIRGLAEFVIAVSCPLRLAYYGMRYNRCNSPDRDYSLDRGTFLSWRSRALRQMIAIGRKGDQI